MANEWYRKRSWGPKRREEFFTRLGRCRDKSEYVRVQAQELLAAASRRSLLGAMELFELYLREYPDSGLEFTAETAITDSGLRYHPTFGLVKKPDWTVYEQLQKLAA